jgi:acylphosphatase
MMAQLERDSSAEAGALDDVTKRVRVTGRVQGVGFRAWAKGRAVGLGLSGWVRNDEDGSVELLLAGDPADVSEMISALHRGPRFAAVEAVEEAEGEASGAAGFVALLN